MNRLANREICERAVSAVDEMIEKNKSCIGIAKAMAEQWGKYIEEARKA